LLANQPLGEPYLASMPTSMAKTKPAIGTVE
jgi:hypothetical protein